MSPGGVGFDINCGVRLIRTNLSEKDVQPVKEQLTQSLFDHIPVGVGSKGGLFQFVLLEFFLYISFHFAGIIPMNARDLEEALEMGMDWSLREGYVWAEDKVHKLIHFSLSRPHDSFLFRNIARNTAGC